VRPGFSWTSAFKTSRITLTWTPRACRLGTGRDLDWHRLVFDSHVKSGATVFLRISRQRFCALNKVWLFSSLLEFFPLGSDESITRKRAPSSVLLFQIPSGMKMQGENSCRMQSLPQRAHILAHPCHHAPICVLLQSMSKQMESNTRRLRASNVQITMRERTGGHDVDTCAQPVNQPRTWVLALCSNEQSIF